MSRVFDVYEGKGIDDGKKSIAIAVTMQPREKTMTDQEIDAVGAKIVAEVTKKTGGTLRGMIGRKMRFGKASCIECIEHGYRPHPADVSIVPRSRSARSPSCREPRADFPASARR